MITLQFLILAFLQRPTWLTFLLFLLLFSFCIRLFSEKMIEYYVLFFKYILADLIQLSKWICKDCLFPEKNKQVMMAGYIFPNIKV